MYDPRDEQVNRVSSTVPMDAKAVCKTQPNDWRIPNGRIIRLLTPEQLEKLPPGTYVTSIAGERKIVGQDKIDTDTRAGFTAFGLDVEAQDFMFGKPKGEFPDEFSFKMALRDANTQAALKTCLFEIDWLLDDYDMRESVFGMKVTELLKSWYAEMENAGH